MPEVVRIARDPALFTFLRDCTPTAATVLGDGRVEIGTAPRDAYDLVVVDAFGGDAPPVHVLTREAINVYLGRLRPGGILLFNISNAYIDFRAVVSATGRSLGLVAYARQDTELTALDLAHGKAASEWMVSARSPADLRGLASLVPRQPGSPGAGLDRRLLQPFRGTAPVLTNWAIGGPGRTDIEHAHDAPRAPNRIGCRCHAPTPTSRPRRHPPRRPRRTTAGRNQSLTRKIVRTAGKVCGVHSGEAHFDFFGLTVSISGWLEVTEACELDFAWFASPARGAAQVVVEVSPGRPSLDEFGPLRASFWTTRNVVYQMSDRTIVDYFGRALLIFDRAQGKVTVQGDQPHLVHEAVYLFVLSQVGVYLDSQGFVRLHALALAGRHGGVVVLLPAGGGKSTLALRALREPGIRLISDDTPVLDRSGRLHAFPLRLGVSEVAAAGIPANHVRRVERFEFPSKHVIALEAFAPRVERQPQEVRHVVVGRRLLGPHAQLASVPRRHALVPLFRDGVVGLGVAQAAEYVLHRGWGDVMGKAGVAARRARICARALSSAQTFELFLGSDGERNWAALAPLLV